MLIICNRTNIYVGQKQRWIICVSLRQSASIIKHQHHYFSLRLRYLLSPHPIQSHPDLQLPLVQSASLGLKNQRGQTFLSVVFADLPLGPRTVPGTWQALDKQLRMIRNVHICISSHPALAPRLQTYTCNQVLGVSAESQTHHKLNISKTE